MWFKFLVKRVKCSLVATCSSTKSIDQMHADRNLLASTTLVTIRQYICRDHINVYAKKSRLESTLVSVGRY